MYGFQKLSEQLKTRGTKRLVVVGAADKSSLVAVKRAQEEGLIIPLLIGDENLIREMSQEVGLDLSDCIIKSTESMEEASMIAMDLVKSGQANAILKGRVTTKDLMGIGLRNGLRREGHLLTHIAVYEHIASGKSLLLSDAGLLPYPNIAQRVQIIRNAVEAAKIIGIDNPKVALLSSSEEVDEKIPCSLDAVKLVEMNQPGEELEGCGQLGGPMDLGAAVDPEAAEIKGVKGPVAGDADILHCPDVVAGNLIGKTLLYFAGPVNVGGCVVGGTVPICLLSRASTADDKYHSIVLGLSCSG